MAADILLRLGCNPNLQDHDGNTPVHFACIHGHGQLLEVLTGNSISVETFNFSIMCLGFGSVYWAVSAFLESEMKQLCHVFFCILPCTVRTQDMVCIK